jgi:hypothetical protein
MDGPPILVQKIRLGLVLKTPENVEYTRKWASKFEKDNGRPETVKAYSI